MSRINQRIKAWFSMWKRSATVRRNEQVWERQEELEAGFLRYPVIRGFQLYFLILLGFLGWGSAAHGQTVASISGTVIDMRGGAIATADVTVKNIETGVSRTINTDDSGRYTAAALEVGQYEIRAEKSGFSPEVRTGITLVVSQHAEVDFMLKVGSVDQSVVVSEDVPAIGVTNEDISGLVGEHEVKDLPLNGRSYDQLLTLNPGVVNYSSQRAGGIGTSNSVVGNMFSSSGHRPQENLYLLNGVEFTSASEINNTPGGVSGQLLGVDAVREFAVVKDGYGAEYGKRPGAQINIVTASGSNQFRGNVYEFIRNSALDARNFFDHGSIPEFQRNVFGGSVGGALRPDKSFLFANYEGFRQRLGLSDLTLVPDAASRAAAVSSVKPLLSLWPVANGPELVSSSGAPSGIAEAFSNPIQRIQEDFGTMRFDQVLRLNDSFSAIYTADDSRAHSPTSNPISFAEVALREQVVSLSETHVFSANLVNRSVFGFSRGGFFFGSGTTVSLPSWIHPGQPVGAVVIGGGTTLNGASQLTNSGTNAGSNLTAARNLFTGSDSLTYTHGIHSLSFGVWLQRIQANDRLTQTQYGQASFSDLRSFLKGLVSTYTYAPVATPMGWRSTEVASYAEDTVKLGRSLELRVGLRTESTSGWNEAHGRAANYVFDANHVVMTQPAIGDSVFSENNAKFLPAPRLGVAWSPFGSNKTVVRAAFGTYYALNDSLSYRLDQSGPFNSVFAVKNIAFASISPTAKYAGAKVVPSGVQANLQTPTVESYMLKLEEQLVKSTTLGIAYIGSHGYHEILSADGNVPTPTICPAAPCPQTYPSLTWFNPTGAPLANSQVLNTTHWFSEGVSSYNGLEVDVNRRLSSGLQFRGVYTFSKILDDGDSLNTSVATNSPAFVSNPLQPKWDYAPGSFDIRHTAVINATYELPFGKHKSSQDRPLLYRFMGDWQVSGIETLQSGLPFTPQLSYNPSNDGDSRNPVRPALNPNFTGPVILGGPNLYFNPNAFIQPLLGTYGNAGRNILRGPRLSETDLSLAKKFSLTERLGLQFRGEVFNLLNHTNLNTPNPVVFTSAASGPSPTAGVITSTSTSSRQIQFGLKLLW